MKTQITAISPIDGRYFTKTRPLSKIMSEYGLIYFRVLVEVRFLQTLANEKTITECPALSDSDNALLESLLANFNEEDALHVKHIESTTNHDVKAVEYFLKEKFNESASLKTLSEFLHFGLTSEDVNNLAYALMIKKTHNEIIMPKLNDLIDTLSEMAKEHINVVMLSRTHGQAASPSTMGKELSNVIDRLNKSKQQLQQQTFLGKCNGAVGNFNALDFAYPDINWQQLTKQFIEQTLGLTLNAYTTQIEPHDWIAELCHSMQRTNTILIDFSRDVWSYISLGYFTQRTIKNEVGSSTMPHKVNPIDFENAEGNLGLSNALFQFFANKLPISRFQRDLTDSTVLRNIGTAFSHHLIAISALLKGLSKLQINQSLMAQELDEQWALLAEPIQTLMRRYGLENPYEQLKALTRGKVIDKDAIHQFIDTLKELPENEQLRLKQLTPSSYLGYAKELTKAI